VGRLIPAGTGLAYHEQRKKNRAKNQASTAAANDTASGSGVAATADDVAK